jgi:ribosomal protein S6
VEDFSYESAIENTAHQEYLAVESELEEVIRELDRQYKINPNTVHSGLVARITELQQLATIRLQDWLDSLDLD